MSKIRFIHQCDVAIGQRIPKGAVVDESTIPADWLAGGLREKFCERVPEDATAVPAAAVTSSPPMPPELRSMLTEAQALANGATA